MRVSVVTCTLPERAWMLRRLVDQIARQVRLPHEWVVAGEAESLAEAEGCLSKWAPWVKFVGVESPPGENIWTMHNAMCKNATGDVICMMDDDDWQSQTRIERQAEFFEYDTEGIELIGTRCFYVLDARQAGKPRCYSARWWGSGGVTGFCFLKSAWERQPYTMGCPECHRTKVPHVEGCKSAGDPLEASGGDVRFAGAHKWYDTRETDLFVHVRHGTNTSDDLWWRGGPVDAKIVKSIMGEADWASYVG